MFLSLPLNEAKTEVQQEQATIVKKKPNKIKKEILKARGFLIL